MKKFIKAIIPANPTSITIYLTLAVLILFYYGVSFLDLMELKTYDLRFKSRGKLSATPEIVIAVLDEKSLDTEGRWPWPRSKIARFIDTLSEEGAKVISFDIVFSEPDENSNLKIIKQFDEIIAALDIRNKSLKEFVDQSKINADNDLALATAIKNSRAKVVLGYFFHQTEEELNYRVEEGERRRQLALIDKSKYGLINWAAGSVDSDPFIEYFMPEANLEMLSGSADGSGYFNVEPDADGVVRLMPLVIRCCKEISPALPTGRDKIELSPGAPNEPDKKEIFPALPVRSVWHYLDEPDLIVEMESVGLKGIRMGKLFIPTDEKGRLLINYLGPAKTFPHYSITDILQKKLPKGTFKDKIVLVGATAVGIYDLRNMPFSGVFPGVEIHATVMDNILTQRFLHKPEWTRIYDFLAIIVLGMVVGIAIPRLSAVNGMLFSISLFFIHILSSRFFFVQFGSWVNIVYPLLGLVLIYTSLTVYHYVTEERERKKIKGAFSFYVSSSVVNEMLKSPEKLKLGGDKRNLSVLFSDIRGFTTISEALSPEDLVHLLNEYLTVMTDIVFKYEGTLDKYMGDAVMAIYGAPLEQADHPSKACASALDMMKGLRQLNEEWIKGGKSPLDIGIGINTGMMMVGNMGSAQRFDYTVMGDAVNLGSRLEGANKNYQTNILISEYTYERVKNDFVCMELDIVKVKGKNLPVRIYQLVGQNDVPAEHVKGIQNFHKGLQQYKKQKWDEAIKIFQTVNALSQNIPAADLFVERSRNLKSNPPSPDWDGVFTMTTK